MKKIRSLLVSFLLCLSLLSFTACATTITAAGAAGIVKTGASAVLLGMTVANATESIIKATEIFTPEQEYSIGLSVANEICKIYPPVDKDLASNYLNKICSAIAINSANPCAYKGFHVIVVHSDDVNAISTPGGHIFITDGLLKMCSSEDEIAAVIAHEIAHVYLRHSIDSIKSKRTEKAIEDIMTVTTTIDVLKSGVDKAAKEMENNTDQLTKILIQSGFSKFQEFAADKLAAELLFNAGYNPFALNDMLDHLEIVRGAAEKKNKRFKVGKNVTRIVVRLVNKKTLSDEDYMSLNKTHPKPKTRIKKLEKVLNGYESQSFDFNVAVRIPRFETNQTLF